MENNKNQTIAYLGTRSEGSLAQAKRPDLNEINKRNAEEERQARKSLYFTTGIVTLSIVVIMLLTYFFI